MLPAPQPPLFQQTKRPPSFPSRLAEHPDSTSFRVRKGPGRLRVLDRVRLSSSACGKTPKARTPSSRAKSEPFSPDKGDFPALIAYFERVKGSRRLAKEMEQKKKLREGFPFRLSPRAVCGAIASARERRKSHVRLKIASPCVPQLLFCLLLLTLSSFPQPGKK